MVVRIFNWSTTPQTNSSGLNQRYIFWFRWLAVQFNERCWNKTKKSNAYKFMIKWSENGTSTAYSNCHRWRVIVVRESILPLTHPREHTRLCIFWTILAFLKYIYEGHEHCQIAFDQLKEHKFSFIETGDGVKMAIVPNSSSKKRLVDISKRWKNTIN